MLSSTATSVKFGEYNPLPSILTLRFIKFLEFAIFNCHRIPLLPARQDGFQNRCIQIFRNVRFLKALIKLLYFILC